MSKEEIVVLPAGPVPEGWEVLHVKNFQAFIDACDYADRKGYLPDAMRDEWEALDFRRPEASPAVAQPVADERNELAPCGTPTGKGIYAWIADGGAALVMVNKRPSDHSPGGVLNGHAMDSTRFYDGCPVTERRAGKWFGPLKSFEPARAALSQPAEGKQP